MSTIWIDVTTSLNWRRPAVGIVRVEAECARHALQTSEKTIRFCAFDADFGYREVSREEVQNSLVRMNTQAPLWSSQPPPSTRTLTLEDRLKSTLLAALRPLPERHRTRIVSAVINRKSTLQEILQGLRHLKSAVRKLVLGSTSPELQAAEINQTPRSRPPFTAGDVYISLGLDWDDKDQEYIHKLRREIDLKILLCCYDVIPVKLPHLCVEHVSARFGRYFADVAWNADEIVCISQHSATDLVELLQTLGTPVPRTSVIRLGSELPATNNEKPSPIDSPYILFVSTIERRKNHETLYRAYTKLLDSGTQNLPKLVFVGMQGWGVDGLYADIRLDPRVQGLIHIRNHVSDDELAVLYKHALFTVYPSLYEGWGLPVAESLAYGKFCIASNAASIPEVGGELVEYIDPWDVPTWADRLAYYIRHPEAVECHEQNIRANFSITPWRTTAESILGIAAQLQTQGKEMEDRARLYSTN